jgi:ribose-phosphate pyrophosphokinase
MIYLNQHKIIPTIFPDKTSQVWKIDESILYNRVNCIKWDFESESEFMHVAQLVDLVNSMSDVKTKLTLWMDYFPYARQDKEVSNTSTFALRTFCKLLSTLKVDNIITQDLHSAIAETYLDNLTNNFPQDAIITALEKSKADIIVYPDKGAKSRYLKKLAMKSITILKERDQLNGNLKIVGFDGDTKDLKGKNVLIVDDLCDGGGTFILAANELKKLDTKTISLYTTHGIYSKGVQVIKDAGISRVFNHKGEV